MRASKAISEPVDDLVLEQEVSLSAAEAYRRWTVEEELKKFFAPDLRIDLRPGGDFEVLFDMTQPEGLRGSEGCVIVGFVPATEVSFTWNFPPSIPTLRDQHTIVRVGFEALGAQRTRVTLRQSGWKKEGAWPNGFEYFKRAWGFVLGNFAKGV
ncbi:MAG: SRPBCC domain-containing protein [Polyangiales bacterium]